MNRTVLLCASAITMLASAPAFGQSAKKKVAVLDVQTSGIDAAHAPLLTEVLTTEIDSLNRFEVIGGRDIDAVLGYERQKELLGCDSATCMAELAGALGAAKIVATRVGKLGNTYVVSMKLIDIKQVRTDRRVSENVQGELDVLLRTLRSSVARLFPPEAAVAQPAVSVAPSSRPSSTPVTAPATASKPSTKPAAESKPAAITAKPKAASQTTADIKAPAPGPSLRSRVGTPALVLWGGGLAAAGIGVAYGLAAKSHQQNSMDPYHVGGQLEIERGQRSQRIANISYAVAAGLGLAGIFVAMQRSPGTKDQVKVAPAVSPTSAGASLWVSW